MKLFCLIGAAQAASFLQNIDMNPEDANYNLKLGAFLKAMGVDVNTDAFFAEDNPTVSNRDFNFINKFENFENPDFGPEIRAEKELKS